jgi:parallel beta-helix repeat protein
MCANGIRAGSSTELRAGIVSYRYSYGNSYINNTIGENGLYGIYIAASRPSGIDSHGDLILNNTIIGNDVNPRYYSPAGIHLEGCWNGRVIGNTVSEHRDIGIHLIACKYFMMSLNNLTGNGIVFEGDYSAYGGQYVYDKEFWNTHMIDSTNTVNDKPIYYLSNNTYGIVPDGAGQVILAYCANVIVSGQTIDNASIGIQVGGLSNNNTVCNNLLSKNGLYGLAIENCDDNIFKNNTISENLVWGVVSHPLLYQDSSTGNVFDNNTISYNGGSGIHMMASDFNIINNNNISENGDSGIILQWSKYNIISNNSLWNNFNDGIELHSDNTIINNNTVGSTHSLPSVPGYHRAGLFIKSNNNIVRDNLFLRIGTDSSYQHGIYLYGNNNYDNTITNNTIQNFGNGIIHYKGSRNCVAYNTIVDGNTGIRLLYCGKVTIENNNITHNIRYGIDLGVDSFDIKILNNTITDNKDGINLGHYIEDGNLIADNLIADNTRTGIAIGMCKRQAITANTLVNNGIVLLHSIAEDTNHDTEYQSSHSIDTSNNVNGKPVYYWVFVEDDTVPSGAGQVILVHCQNVKVVDQDISYASRGVQIFHCSNLNITENTVTKNLYNFVLVRTMNSELSHNDVTDALSPGLGIYWSFSYGGTNRIADNNLSTNSYGLQLRNVQDFEIHRNLITNNMYHGIALLGAQNNIIHNNTIELNDGRGLYSTFLGSYECKDNWIHHNNFIDNRYQIYEMGANYYDDDYGHGNYWSDYTGADDGSGVGRKGEPKVAGDGIGDSMTPHLNQDWYPFMERDSWLNQPPIADAGGPYEVYEGTPVTFDASASTDPDDDPLQYRWDFENDGFWDTDWSDSPYAEILWEDDYTGTVTVQVFDGVKYTTDTAEVTVYNVAPTIDSFSVSPGEPVKLGDLTTVSAGYTDPGSETLSTTIDWGDETSTTATGDSIEETHEYATTGVYTITLSVTDGVATVDTTYRYLVVYDPDGGFVTGGGWISSPEGAYIVDETLSGKATFGFVSKYKNGATVPSGNVRFQFKVGDLVFNSDDFEWLVVAGAKAKFKGTGTINGEGNFGFMISAIDGDDDGKDDTFRIKIWDKDDDDAVVYDNQMGADDDDAPTTALGGGQIVIHNPK